MRRMVLVSGAVAVLVAGAAAAVVLTRPDDGAAAPDPARLADIELREAGGTLLAAPSVRYTGWYANKIGEQKS
jgi:hypothetical protein